MTSATPKPRAGEHVETPETNEFAYERLRGPTQGQRYKDHSEWLNFARKLEAERDALKAQLGSIREQFADYLKKDLATDTQQKELVEALSRILSAWSFISEGEHPHQLRDAMRQARAVLAKRP